KATMLMYSFLQTAQRKCGFFILVVLAGIVFRAPHAQAQTMPVGSFYDNQFRILQLLSDSTSEISFMDRPITEESYQKALENVRKSDSWWARPAHSFEIDLSEDFVLGFYDPIIKGTYNSMLPYGENNGAAWYGRGTNWNLWAASILAQIIWISVFAPRWFISKTKTLKLRLISHINPM